MEGDLVVQGTVLDSTVTSMAALRAEFDGLDRSLDATEHAWGSADLAQAVQRFGQDWDDRRAKLSTAMRAVEQMAKDCAREFTRVDDELGTADPVSRPTDWSPLRGSDPVPGDPQVAAEQVRHLRDVAVELQGQVARLQQLSAEGALRGQYADRLREAAGDLVDDLSRVQGRYSRVASALAPWSGQLSHAQSDAERLRSRAQLLDAERERLEAVAGSYRPGTLPPDATPAQQASADAGAAAHARVLARLSEIRRELQELDDQLTDVERQRDRDARAVAHEVRDTLDDNVKDSRWDDVKGAVSAAVHRAADAVSSTVSGAVDWVGAKIDQYADAIKKGLEILSWIATGLAVAALFIPGINVLVVAGLALALVIGHGALLATGNGSTAEFGLAVFGLLTFGVGAAAGRLALAARSSVVRAAAPLAGSRAAASASRATAAARSTLGRRLGRNLTPVQRQAARAELTALQNQTRQEAARRSARAQADYAAKRPLQPTRREVLLAGGDRDAAAVARDIARARRQFPEGPVPLVGHLGTPAVRVMQGAFLTGATADLADKALGQSDLTPRKPFVPAYQDWKDGTTP